MTKRSLWRLVGVAVLALVAAGIIAPNVRADRYGEEIRNGLQRALGRKVDILGPVTFNIFTGPGFSIEKVVVADDLSAGIEPFAYVDRLEARVSFGSLLLGRLDFSKVRLVDPYVNLVKHPNSAWNVLPLLKRTPVKDSVMLPPIEVTGGRFNFKFGDTKSAFYLRDADVTITRGSQAGAYQIRFTGEPSRTDRAARGFGSLQGRGTWISGPENRLDLDVELERSGIDEIVTLVRGDDVGVHGMVSSRLHISGPVSNLTLSGRVQMEDVHRWDLLHSRGGAWALNVKGICNLTGQTLALQAVPEANAGTLPFSLQGSVTGLLSAPHWSANLNVQGVSAPAMLEAARHMGAPLPPHLDVEGNVTGVVTYDSSAGFAGSLQAADTMLRVGAESRLRVPEASIRIDNGGIQLLPSILAGDSGQEATVEAAYNPQTSVVEAVVTGRRLRISGLQRESGGLLGGYALPLADKFKGGLWTGTLRFYESESTAGQWSGKISVRDTSLIVPGIAEPVKLNTASVELDGEHLALKGFRAVVGNLECYGQYRYDPGQDRPHRLNVAIISADLAELERLLSPTLHREGGFLARTLRLRQPSAPDWLQGRRADGTVRIGTLTAGMGVLKAVRSHIVWNGPVMTLDNFTARFEDGAVSGVATAFLNELEPRYTLRGSIQNWTWHGGKLDLTGQANTEGAGTDLLLNFTSEGAFHARGVTFPPDSTLRLASGTYDLSIARTGPQVKLTSLQAALGSEQFSGEGGTQADGKLAINLASANRTVHISGPLAPLRLELRERSTAR